MAVTKKKKIIIIIIALIFLGFLNYLYYLNKVSKAKKQLAADNEKIVSILKTENYNIKSLPYAVVDIKNVDDILANKDFFSSVQKNDRVYYFENEDASWRLIVLYRPATGSVVNIQKE